MKIIGKTNEGFILEASTNDIKHILTATNGSCDIDKVNVGQKIPAIDYSMTISKVNELSSSYPLDKIKGRYSDLGRKIEEVGELLSSTKIQD